MDETTGFEMLSAGPWPALSEDQKTELRTAAPQLVAASIGASKAARSLAESPRAQGFWQSAALSANASFAAIASGVALFGATVAWLACGDGEGEAAKKGE